MSNISIKLVPGFRDHILMATHFDVIYLSCVEEGLYLGDEEVYLPPPDTFAGITTSAEVRKLNETFGAKKEGDNVRLSDRENVLLHACFVLMSYALVTPVGEMICKVILQEMNKDKHFVDFAEYRGHNLEVNAHLIESAREKLADVPGFEEMQEALSAISVD